MAQLDFYANSSDIITVIDYMFELAPMKLYEAYSRKNHEIREFSSTKDLLQSSHIEDNHGRIFVRGWWGSVTANTYVRRFNLNPTIGNFRESLEGLGTFQIIQGGPHNLADNALALTHITHWNEKGALQRANCAYSEIAEVNWQEFKRLSGKLNRHIKNKVSTAKLFKRPILEGAYLDLINGGKLFGYPGIFAIDSSEIDS